MPAMPKAPGAAGSPPPLGPLSLQPQTPPLWDGNTQGYGHHSSPHSSEHRSLRHPLPGSFPGAIGPTRFLPRCRRADTSPGQTDASRQPVCCGSRVTERRDGLILRLFIGISLGSALVPRPRRAGAWLTGRHCGGFALQRPPKRSRSPPPPPRASPPHVPLMLPGLCTKPH